MSFLDRIPMKFLKSIPSDHPEDYQKVYQEVLESKEGQEFFDKIVSGLVTALRNSNEKNISIDYDIIINSSALEDLLDEDLSDTNNLFSDIFMEAKFNINNINYLYDIYVPAADLNIFNITKSQFSERYYASHHISWGLSNQDKKLQGLYPPIKPNVFYPIDLIHCSAKNVGIVLNDSYIIGSGHHGQSRVVSRLFSYWANSIIDNKVDILFPDWREHLLNNLLSSIEKSDVINKISNDIKTKSKQYLIKYLQLCDKYHIVDEKFLEEALNEFRASQILDS